MKIKMLKVILQKRNLVRLLLYGNENNKLSMFKILIFADSKVIIIFRTSPSIGYSIDLIIGKSVYFN